MTDTQNATIKWGGKTYQVPVHSDMSGTDFKEEISRQLGIPPKRQKLLGVKIVDAEPLPEKVVTGKQPVLVVGSAEQSTQLRSEDTSKEQEAKPKDPMAEYLKKEIIGLTNVGNTCYLNAAVQMLRSIKDIRIIFEKLSPKEPLLAALKNLILSSGDQEKAAIQLKLMSFVGLFHIQYPAFAEKSETGALLQHDSHECLSILLSLVQQAMNSDENYKGKFDELFQIISEEVFECTEGEEESREKHDKLAENLMLVCHLREDTLSIEQGIQVNFEKEHIEKHSEALQKNAIWEKTTTLKTLPPYLFVHVARFTWRGDTGQRAKILKSITFPMTLNPRRFAHADFPKDEYELQSVISHKGRSADSGHYIAWGKHTIHPEDFTEKSEGKTRSVWVVLDDDCSSPVSEEDIKRLSGGGEYHSAYILLYRRVEAEAEST